jgi:hypothetical protein
MRRRFVIVTLMTLASFTLLLAGCNQNTKDPNAKNEATAQQQTPDQGSQALPEGHPPIEGMTPSPGGKKSPTSIAGVSFTVPSEWVDLGPAGMRAAQFQLPPVDGDKAPAEVSVFYFGPSSGGGVDANIQRWIGQMTQADGGNSADLAKKETIQVDGMPVHIVSLDGTFNPGSMSADNGPHEGYRMMGAIVEGAQGSVFFKLTGPKATATQMEAGLRDLVSSFKKES